MPRLTDPFQLRGLRLANRLVMAPMATGLAVDAAPVRAQLDWYASRARSGVGLVIVEAAAVAPDALVLPTALGIWDDRQVAGLSRLARAVHEAGVPVVQQIVHAGPRAARAAGDGAPRLGASTIPLAAGPPPRAMTDPEIESTIAAFAAAARRAQAAGFDGVEIHAAHFYLLSAFLSPCSNRRTDGWGTDRAGRARLAVEVARAVRRAVGPDYPIVARMNAFEVAEGGLTPEDADWSAAALVQAGVDLIDASVVGQASLESAEGHRWLSTAPVPPRGTAPGAFAHHAARLRAAVNAPIIAVGQLGAPGLAQRILDRGQADLVALARQLIADPDAGRKVLAGREDELRACTQCFGCFAAIRKGRPIRCSVNPAVFGGVHQT